jgi:hypothetical protein
MSNSFWDYILVVGALCAAFFCMGVVAILLAVIAKAVGAE